MINLLNSDIHNLMECNPKNSRKNAIDKLLTLEIPFKETFEVETLLIALKEAYSKLNEEIFSLFKKYGSESKLNGIVKREIKSDYETIYTKKHFELMSTQISIQASKIKKSYFDNIDICTLDRMSISKLIKD